MAHAVVIFLFCILILPDPIFGEESAPVITIRSGKVKGLSLKNGDEREFYAYRAIPYAKSTAGHLRFKPPQPVDSWDTVFDATQYGPECPQFNIITRGVEGSEDCLVVNVYMPKIESGKQLPVLVFIHGGGFAVGTGSYAFYGPQRFMNHDVVLVTFNYRLGLLGYLSTQDEELPGNYGMLDQVLALRWVKDNIASFGGNPEKITIFGESAGSASVIYHLLSPLSTGLFHGAIAQSGTPINHWANQKHPLEFAKTVAGLVKCSTNSTKAMASCFKEKTLYDLIRPPIDLQRSDFFPIYHSPTVERSGGHGFLIDDPLMLLREGRIVNKVPLIIGLTKMEMITFYYDLMKSNKYEGQEHLDKEFPTILPMLFDMDPYSTEVCRPILKEYFKDSDVNDENNFDNVLLKLMSDATFAVGIAQTADLIAGTNIPTWAYMYTHVGQHSLTELSGVKPGKYATHADELFIQFPFFFAQYAELNDMDKRMAHILISLWVKFANRDDLTIDTDHGEHVRWDLYDPKNPRYLELNVQPQMKTSELCDKLQFWIETLPQFSNKMKIKTEL